MSSNRDSATFTGHNSLQVITKALIGQKADDASRNPRLREILAFHENDFDTLQRMLNAIQPGSYIHPHRHITPPKAEGLVLMSGSLGFIPFTDSGEPDIDRFVHISEETGIVGVDYRAGLWHTFIALESNTVVYEVKPGPYDAATDKEFAPWAPAEGMAEAEGYLVELETLFRMTKGLPKTV